MIQLKTVNHRGNPSDYWDEFRVVEYTDEYMGKEREAYIARSESVEDVIESADYDSFIVNEEPSDYNTHPNADVIVKAYDGYNE